jgi:hypothetical protein
MKTTQRIILALVFFGIGSIAQNVQAQNRSYIEFVQNTGNVSELIQGLRIKKTADSTKYWLMGRTNTGIANGTYLSTAVAIYDPALPPVTPHAFYTMPNSVTGSAASEDFVVDTNSITTTGTLVRDFTSPPSQEIHTSLFSVQSNLTAGPNHRYIFPAPSGLPPLQQFGKAIVHKTDNANGGPAYILASDAFDPNNNVYYTVVTSVSIATMIPNWQLIIRAPQCIGANGNNHPTSTFVQDIIRDENGDYYIVGYTENACNSNRDGVIIKVNQNGTFASRKVFPFPLGPGMLLFKSVSMITGNAGTRYIVSGTAWRYNSPEKKGIFVGVFDVNGTPIQAQYFRVAGGETEADGSRHTITIDNDLYWGSVSRNIVIAGTLKHDVPGYPSRTAGTLLRLYYHDNQFVSPLGDCGFLMWKEYGYYDYNRERHMNMQFADVTPRVRDTPPLGGEVAVIGNTLGWEKASGQRQDYMVFMDLDASMVSQESGCFTNDISCLCRQLVLIPSEPTVNVSSNFDYRTPMPMFPNMREPVYFCSDLYLYKPIIEEEPQPIKGYANDLQISPVPNDGGMSNLNLSLSESDNVTVSLYDARGVEVMQIASQYFNAGTHTLNFNCAGLPSGMYALRVKGSVWNKTVMLPIVR